MNFFAVGDDVQCGGNYEAEPDAESGERLRDSMDKPINLYVRLTQHVTWDYKLRASWHLDSTSPHLTNQPNTEAGIHVGWEITSNQ